MSDVNVLHCIALRRAEGQDVGFLLASVADGALAGACVFMVLPGNPVAFASQGGQALLARKGAGESRIALTYSTSLTITVVSPGLPHLLVELDDSGAGTWREADPGTASGLAAAAPAR